MFVGCVFSYLEVNLNILRHSLRNIKVNFVYLARFFVSSRNEWLVIFVKENGNRFRKGT